MIRDEAEQEGVYYNTAAVIQKELTRSVESTPATRAGILPEAILTAAGLAALVAAFAFNLRNRRADAAAKPESRTSVLRTSAD